MNERIFTLNTHVRFSDKRSVVTEIVSNENSSIAVWGVRPGQKVEAHFHPDGQDTWVMLQGNLTYHLGNSENRTLSPGELALAEQGQVHGAINEGTEDAVFVSIYSAPKIGYVKASP
ncbi:cupin domain-containing protein [Argonema galeatum]|uniref:cupin domain-containing protein n=1 Tax=Argonema galeatum TaxID=2942762 RepID=UPI0020120083|nr:cupin domain-containing protein [Argonema galeatum]MCL1466478.1 cupin domain-containing protein [Argonema galeatum A003/A1]